MRGGRRKGVGGRRKGALGRTKVKGGRRKNDSKQQNDIDNDDNDNNGSTVGSMDSWIGGLADESTVGSMDSWIVGWVDAYMEERRSKTQRQHMEPTPTDLFLPNKPDRYLQWKRQGARCTRGYVLGENKKHASRTDLFVVAVVAKRRRPGNTCNDLQWKRTAKTQHAGC